MRKPLDTNAKGSIGELEIAAELMRRGYAIYFPLGSKVSFDLVAVKDNKLFRVSCKATAAVGPSGGYRVELRSIRVRRSGNQIRKFSSRCCDILAVYIIPEDRVALIDPLTVKAKHCIIVRGCG